MIKRIGKKPILDGFEGDLDDEAFVIVVLDVSLVLGVKGAAVVVVVALSLHGVRKY